ncbi:hypothetical protein ACQQ2N_00415 [Dokdonella sp. MW10]|uniref:hypothetical protein n=1 Tax=Dokdonella sp. MW10 TaxID=2992926 RepID=UPI003F7CE3B6
MSVEEAVRVLSSRSMPGYVDITGCIDVAGSFDERMRSASAMLDTASKLLHDHAADGFLLVIVDHGFTDAPMLITSTRELVPLRWKRVLLYRVADTDVLDPAREVHRHDICWTIESGGCVKGLFASYRDADAIRNDWEHGNVLYLFGSSER